MVPYYANEEYIIPEAFLFCLYFTALIEEPILNPYIVINLHLVTSGFRLAFSLKIKTLCLT